MMHSKIPDEGLWNLFFPAKPDVSPETEIECTRCGQRFAYTQIDLRYQA
jgi:hypothetical protein